MTYDLIGDIHGQYTRLKRVLKKLGYEEKKGVYSKFGHKAIFIGDVVDRGANSAKALELVKRMVENDHAEMIMGNHEYNLWGYFHKDENGEFLRDHSPKNEIQILSTLRSYEGKAKLLDKHLEWIGNLPVYINKKRFRAVHACWDRDCIQFLKNTSGRRVNEDVLYDAYTSNKKLKKALKVLLSGVELSLPEGQFFHDTDGIPRTRFRYKWWEGIQGQTYRSIAVKPDLNTPRKKIKKELKIKDREYHEGKKPLFIGHYSMKGTPHLLNSNVCCLDWVKRTNRIAVYRLGGEPELMSENLKWFY